jgi:hypothetical protein
MLMVPYEVRPSDIPGSGKGIFLTEAQPMGKVMAWPDRMNRLYDLSEVRNFPPDSIAWHSAVCWFEDRFTTMDSWTEEAYINHSFEPNCLWHLSFVIARHNLPVGTELTINYEHLLGEGIDSEFTDQVTGRKIVGASWQSIMQWNAAELLRIYR